MFEIYNDGGGNCTIEMNGITYFIRISVNPNINYVSGKCYYHTKDICFNLPVRTNYRRYIDIKFFKSLIAHELTHAFNHDNRIHYYTIKGKAYHYKRPTHEYIRVPFSTNEPNDFNVIDCIQDILYRLWDNDERTAYLTSAYDGIEEAKKYINRLNMEIQKLENDNTFNDVMWFNILENYGVIKYLKGRGKNLKKSFIKKSKYLLNWFSKKLMSNVYNYI